MRIDCQTHVFPREYAEVLSSNPHSPQTTRQGDQYLIAYGYVQNFQLRLDDYSIEAKLRDMDAADIDISVLSVNMPGPELLEAAVGIEGAHVCNDYLAKVVQERPDRFVGLACLPWQDVPAALEELEWAIKQLDLRGVMLYSQIAGGPVDMPKYEPIYAAIETLGVPLILHPCVPAWGEEIKDYSMITMAGLMVDHSFAMLRLLLSGILERHPRLTVVQPHAGGVLPYLWGRISHQTEVMGRGMEHISQPPAVYYHRQVYLDTVSPSPLALRHVYDFQGPDRLLFGSDHPWVKPELLTAMIEEMDIPPEDKAKILGKNAQALFKIG